MGGFCSRRADDESSHDKGGKGSKDSRCCKVGNVIGKGEHDGKGMYNGKGKYKSRNDIHRDEMQHDVDNGKGGNIIGKGGKDDNGESKGKGKYKWGKNNDRNELPFTTCIARHDEPEIDSSEDYDLDYHTSIKLGTRYRWYCR
jgi:hypothetical protein